MQNYAVNNAVSKMWRAYDWRGTTAELPPFWLVSGQQDYGKPLYTIPTDYDGLREVYLVFINGNNPTRYPMKIVKDLQRTHVQSFPDCIAYQPAIAGFRVHPCSPFGVTCPNYLIDGIYKKKPPQITSLDTGDTLLWDDIYFDSFVQAYIWAMLRVSERDPRNAAAQEQVFYQTLAEATSSENLELGEPQIAPSEPLGVIRGGMGGNGWFGGIWGGY